MNFKEHINPTTTVKVMTTHVPRIGITSDALAKMFIYVQECTDEIGWLGTVQALESGRHFIIDDVYLFEQQVHGATTEITPEGLATFGEELLSTSGGLDTWNRMQMWGHSHVNMMVSPSGQDDKQMEEFSQIGHDFFIRLICNKKGDMKLDFFNYKLGITFIDVPWEIMQSSEENSIQEEIFRLQFELEQKQAVRETAYKETIKEEMKQKVRKFQTQTYAQTKNFKNAYGYWENDVWHRYTDEEKKISAMTTGTDNNLGGKKKEESAQNVGIGDTFEDDDDVVSTFSSWELLMFSELITFDELQKELELYGWEELSDNDVERVMRVTLKYKNQYK